MTMALAQENTLEQLTFPIYNIDPEDPNEKINHKNQLDEATRRQNEIYKSPDFYNK